MPPTLGGNPNLDRLSEQLDRLLADGCCAADEMVVFPVPANSGSLAELARAPGIAIDRIGPDVVRVRRAA